LTGCRVNDTLAQGLSWGALVEEEEFQIVLQGEVLDGFDPEQVARQLAELFRRPPEVMRQALQGTARKLPRRLSRDKAESLCRRIRRRGAACSFEAVAPALVDFEFLEQQLREAERILTSPDRLPPAVPATQPIEEIQPAEPTDDQPKPAPVPPPSWELAPMAASVASTSFVPDDNRGSGSAGGSEPVGLELVPIETGPTAAAQTDLVTCPSCGHRQRDPVQCAGCGAYFAQVPA